MPYYQGGKSRIGRDIYNVITSLETKLNWQAQEYFEPFAGFLNVGIHGAKQGRHILACDANEDIIKMWQAFQKGWMPKEDECSREEFERLKNSKVHSAKRGLIGISCAYGGIFFAGYRAKIYKHHSGLQMMKRVIKKQILPWIDHFTFLPAQSYTEFKNLKGFTIYCDPPYYKNNLAKTNPLFDFDHETFWNIMRKWSKKNLVIISEYVAPEDFVEIWSKTVKASHNAVSRPHLEKLFIHESWYEKL